MRRPRTLGAAALTALVCLAPGGPAAYDDTTPCPPGSWHVWQRAAGGLDSDFVNDIVDTADGSVVFATNDLYPVETHGGGISVRGTDGAWTVHRRAAGGLRSDTVYSLAANPGTLYAGTLKGAAYIDLVDGAVPSEGWRGLPSRPVMPFRLTDVSDVVHGVDFDTWFATNSGLFRMKEDRSWERYGTDAEAGELRGRFISAVADDVDSGIWIGTSGHGVAHWDVKADAWRRWTVAEGRLCNDYVYDIDVDAFGRPWVGTGIGACRYTLLGKLDGRPPGPGWEHVTSRNSPLPDDDVRAVLVDRRGRTWFGTHRGVAVREGEEWKDGVSWGVCSPTTPPAAAASPDGAPASGLPHRLVVAIHEAADGTIWFGTYGGGVASFTPAAP